MARIMANWLAFIGIIAVCALSNLALAENTTLSYYCPQIACKDDQFIVWVEYQYNDTDILDGDVTADIYDLNYNSSTKRYQSYFSSAVEETWNYTIWSNSTNSSYSNLTANCSTEILTCFNLTVALWEQEEFKTYAKTDKYIITEHNYDKQLTNRYINEFAWVIAQNNDKNATGAYSFCSAPISAGQEWLGWLNIGNWADKKHGTTNTSFSDLITPFIGCDNYWFRAKYLDGEAILRLPYSGNYSLFILDGAMSWENGVSPPKITKSNLFLPLGVREIPDKADYTANYWVSHAELDFWGSIIDGMYILFILLGFLIFVALIMFGITSPGKAAGIAILWCLLWTILRSL